MEETQRFVFKSGVGAERGLGSGGGRNGEKKITQEYIIENSFVLTERWTRMT